ncbi:hypothetical protein ASC75_10080 [Aminobacter sp. DSM 101952]|uniref:hypothetical protein n=1 Tax=Aminobacter sp. DSM 101952 TaxID=2735891 RepID=UPI0006F25925|nr:hypothetical protein [Aminobacter sp. DSM 101952]KQU66932.1 hypothetical protein ASC75_10080 [Aminobacter sp. DSM 101952]
MKVTMKLTLDGLKRALRWKAHELAENAEQGYRDAMPAARLADVPSLRARAISKRERNDDRPGR